MIHREEGALPLPPEERESPRAVFMEYASHK